jgi:long-chain acyl-CoA synthetase
MMMSGGTVVIMEKFDTINYLALVEKYRATITQLVPTMFIRMLKLPDKERLKFDISSLQMAIHAAAPCPVPIKEQMIEWWGPILFEYYAGTEGNGFVKITSSEWLSHKGSVGQILGGTIHILDEAGQEMPTGEVGTVYFETESTFEYYKDPEKTAQSRSDEGWTTLGDIGYLDGEGYLYLTDRKADMIISGGVNIYPQEAENIIVMHPKVTDVAVFGIPHEEFGEEVKAVVQPVDMDQAGPEFEEEILNFCQQRLARIKCPKSVDFEAELPRSPTGKLLKRIIRNRYWEGRTRTGISAPAST